MPANNAKELIAWAKKNRGSVSYGEGFADPEYKALAGMYLIAPAGVPAAILAQIEKIAREAVHSAAMKTLQQGYGLDPVGGASEATRKEFETALPIIERLAKVSGTRAE